MISTQCIPIIMCNQLWNGHCQNSDKSPDHYFGCIIHFYMALCGKGLVYCWNIVWMAHLIWKELSQMGQRLIARHWYLYWYHSLARSYWLQNLSPWSYTNFFFHSQRLASQTSIGHWAWIDNYINPLRAKFFRVNINMYLHFMSFLHIGMTQVLKILPQIR